MKWQKSPFPVHVEESLPCSGKSALTLLREMSPYPIWNGREAAASILRLSSWLVHLSRKALCLDRRENES